MADALYRYRSEKANVIEVVRGKKPSSIEPSTTNVLEASGEMEQVMASKNLNQNNWCECMDKSVARRPKGRQDYTIQRRRLL